MADFRKMQERLGVKADNIVGIGTLSALFSHFGAKSDRALDLAIGANVHFPAYGILDNSLRLVHFIAQTGHESASFKYMEEIWGPTPAQIRYEGRIDLGNVQPGDGKRYSGHGMLQVTGRKNHRRIGRRIGIDLETHPHLAAVPSISVHTACVYWEENRINLLADADDIRAVTKSINGGYNGLEDRKARTAKAKAIILN